MPLEGRHAVIPAVSGDALTSVDGWRLYLLKQCNLIIELLGREWPDPPLQSLVAANDAGSETQGNTDGKSAVPLCSTCGSDSEHQEKAEDPLLSDYRLEADRADRAYEEFCTRSFTDENFVALWMSAAYVQAVQYTFVVGVTEAGYKRILSLAACSLQHTEALKGMLEQLARRGLRMSESLLYVIPGAVGLRRALVAHSGDRIVVQRCLAEKRARVLSYLPQEYRLKVGRALHHAWGALEYGDALGALKRLQQRVYRINESAGRALAKGLEETLTVHRAGAYMALGRSLTTTRVITRLAQRLCGRLRQRSDWMPSDQRSTFMALDLMAMEAGMYRLGHAAYLPALREQLTGLNQPHSTRI